MCLFLTLPPGPIQVPERKSTAPPHAPPAQEPPAAADLARVLEAAHPMEAHQADSRAMFARGQSADVREGIESFSEKRDPVFADRVSDGLPEIVPGWREPEFR